MTQSRKVPGKGKKNPGARHRGFVSRITSNPSGPPFVVVRVQDSQSPFDGKTFLVDFNVGSEVKLAQGMNVSFRLASWGEEGGGQLHSEPSRRAVGVELL